jgi:hypothetical protein
MLPVQHTQLRAQTDLAAPSLATRLFANAGGLERSCGDAIETIETSETSDSWPGCRAEAFAGGLHPSRLPLARR